MPHSDILRAAKKRARQARAAKKMKIMRRKNDNKWAAFEVLLERFYGGGHLSPDELKMVS